MSRSILRRAPVHGAVRAGIQWIVLAAAGLACRADPVAVDGFTHVQSLAGIDEYRLDKNGLQVLLMTDHSAPVVTFEVTYRVGSRNEVTGTTGATHILEHMMFKGSETYNDPKGNSVKQYLGRVGGEYNANTWLDRTTYFATVGRDYLEGYIAIEADRMRNLWLHGQDRWFEMVVVRNEYERGENNPDNALEKEVTAAAYQALPYHHSTIGWRSDIEKVTIEKLREFYDTFYWPNNATATVVGDFDPAETLGLIQRYYGKYPSSPKPIPDVYTEEPEQTGPRRVTVKRPGHLGSVLIAHKVPNARDPDYPALNVLDSILSDGKDSRLYRALVDKGLATEVGADTGRNRDLSLHTLSADLTPGTRHEDVEAALLAAVERVKSQGVTVEEVDSAIRQERASTFYARDGSAAVSRNLVEWIAAGDWTLYATYPEKIARVTPGDVQRVARKYLDADLSTTGWFVPKAPETAEKVTPKG